MIQSILDAPGSCHGLDAVRGVEGPAVMQLLQVALVCTCALQDADVDLTAPAGAKATFCSSAAVTWLKPPIKLALLTHMQSLSSNKMALAHGKL